MAANGNTQLTSDELAAIRDLEARRRIAQLELEKDRALLIVDENMRFVLGDADIIPFEVDWGNHEINLGDDTSWVVQHRGDKQLDLTLRANADLVVRFGLGGLGTGHFQVYEQEAGVAILSMDQDRNFGVLGNVCTYASTGATTIISTGDGDVITIQATEGNEANIDITCTGAVTITSSKDEDAVIIDATQGPNANVTIDASASITFTAKQFTVQRPAGEATSFDVQGPGSYDGSLRISREQPSAGEPPAILQLFDTAGTTWNLWMATDGVLRRAVTPPDEGNQLTHGDPIGPLSP